MAEVVLRNIVKRYGAVEAVRGIDLHIEDREFVALVGPSGCGKSTTLRMIAGLESISSGDILIGNSIVNEIPPKRRDIAMVFQSYALYPHMTVYSNMSFGLRMRSFSNDEIRRRVADAAKILDIEELLDRRPGQLSGGQRQRVAMGRAIVRDPQVFLFDEPLSNLDAKLRVQMRTEIKRVHLKVQTTTIYVTHDQVEAMTLADKVVVMNKGLIEQVGSPHEVYHAPRTRFVAGFMGSPSMNFIDCQLVANGSALSVVLRDGTRLPVPAERTGRYNEWVGKDLEFGIRPEHISGLHGTAARKNTTKLAVKPDVIEPTGMETMVFFSIGGTEICARVDPETPLQLGEESHLRVNMAQMHLIDKATGRIVWGRLALFASTVPYLHGLSYQHPEGARCCFYGGARAFRWKGMLESGEFATIAELAGCQGIALSCMWRLLRLTLLAPDIIEELLDAQGSDLQLAQVLEPFPLGWESQEQSFDFYGYGEERLRHSFLSFAPNQRARPGCATQTSFAR